MRSIFQRNRHTPSQAGAGCLIPFSLFWMAFSSVFMYLGLFGFSGKNFDGWEKVPCLIEEFEITDDANKSPPFGLDVVFRYSRHGAEFTGTKTGKEEHREDDYRELEEKRAKLMAQPEAECLVNPQDPSDAVLDLGNPHNRLGGLILSIFGGCFFLIGVGLFVLAIRQVRRQKREKAGGTSVTTAKREQEPRLILYPFFTLFALAGTGILFALVVPMWKNRMAAKSWVEVPGEVIWSRVKSHKGDDSTTYSPHIFYRYNFEGKTYRSDRRSFANINGSDSKASSIVKNHPAGSAVTVFVDPRQPEESVLRRELGGSAWFSLFPLPFMAVGFGGLFWLLRGGGKKSQRPGTTDARRGNRNVATTADPRSSLVGGESLRLAPGKDRLLKLVGVLFIAAFWNGIVSVFQYQLLKDWGNDGFRWGMALFMTPFTLIGIGLLGAFLHQAGAFFNPRPILHLDGGPLRIGGNVTLRWEIAAGAGRLRSLRIVLRGEEVATYRRGTNSTTERSTFHEAEILSTERVEMMPSGRAALRIPAESVPSWKTSNNRIEWSLVVEGTIGFWPDISDTHSIKVLPA